MPPQEQAVQALRREPDRAHSASDSLLRKVEDTHACPAMRSASTISSGVFTLKKGSKGRASKAAKKTGAARARKAAGRRKA